jgi:hypothetical protein
MLITKTVTKKALEVFIQKTFVNFGNIYTANLLDSIKFLGFYYATCSGLSITIDDLKTPNEKDKILKETEFKISKIDETWYNGTISETERFETIINSWNQASDSLKNKIVDYYRYFDPCNSLYIMAFSGARGNISQIRQLIGMRGLMADQSGNIINLPITSNFREGLSSIDYIISSYGARKGIVDTALKTADSGYLTRRLIYLARNILVKHYDCETNNGVLLFLTEKNVSQNLVGKILISENLFDFSNKGKIIDENFFTYLKKKHIKSEVKYLPKKTFILKVRSPITCKFHKSICQICYGWDLSKRKLISIGETIGITAAQSVGEPGTQLTMRTFHTGGIFTSELVHQNRADFSGKLCLPKEFKSIFYRNTEGKIVLKLLQDISAKLIHWTGETKNIFLEIGSYLYFSNSQYIRRKDIISESIKKNVSSLEFKMQPIYSYFEGEIRQEDITPLLQEKTNKIEKEGIFWLRSGKNHNLSLAIHQTYPKILTPKKSLGFLKFVSPVKGLIKKNIDTIVIQKNSLKFTFKTGQLLRKLLSFFYERIYHNYFLKLNFKLKNNFPDSIFEKNISYFVYKSDKSKENLEKRYQKVISTINFIKNYFITTHLNLRGDYYFDEEIKENNENFQNTLILPFYVYSRQKENLKQKTKIFIKNIQYIDSYTILGKIFFYPLNFGKIYGAKIKKNLEKNILNIFFITKKDIWKYYSDQNSATFLLPNSENQTIIQRGNYFNPISKSFNSGFLLNKDGFRFIFQTAQPIFLPASTKIKFKEKEFVKEKILLATLVSSNQQTQDIVQGLPKIEELLEGYFEQKSANTSSSVGIFIPEQIIKSTTYLNTRKIHELGYQTTLCIPENKNDLNPFIQNLLVEEGEEEYYGTIFESFTSLRNIFLFQNSLYSLFPIFSEFHPIEEIQLPKSLFFYKKNGKIGKKQVIYEVSSKNFLKKIYLLAPNNKLLAFYIKPLTNNIQNNYLLSLKYDSEFINLLEQLNIGNLSPRELLLNLSLFYRRRLGIQIGNNRAVHQFQLILVNSIQAIYYSQGVTISSKHLEIITHEMVSRGRILNGGNTPFFVTETVNLGLLNAIYERLEYCDNNFNYIEGPLYEPILESITNAALRKEGFLSNAGFQQTKQILVKSALLGQTDWINGLKESIIIGRSIPAGSLFLNNKAYLDSIFKIHKKSKKKKKSISDLNGIVTKEFEKIDKLSNSIEKEGK